MLGHKDALKESVGWQCQKCHRLCRKKGESVEAFLKRVGDQDWRELAKESDRPLEGNRDRLSAFVLCAMPDGGGGHLLLCAACAMHFIRPYADPKHKAWRLELQGQMRLPGV